MTEYYKALRVTAPSATKKKTDEDHQGVAFAKQEWVKDVTCFGYGKKGHLIGRCHSTIEEERQKV